MATPREIRLNLDRITLRRALNARSYDGHTRGEVLHALRRVERERRQILDAKVRKNRRKIWVPSQARVLMGRA